MKKIIISILLVSVMLTTLIIPASAATGNLSATAKFSADKKTITVDLNLQKNPGIVSLIVDAEYDNKVLKLKSSENKEIFSSVTPGPATNNPYRLVWYELSAEDITTNGVLATYTFEVLNNASVNASDIKFTAFDVVNAKFDDSSEINGCALKINLKDAVTENTPLKDSQSEKPAQNQSQTSSQSNASSNDAAANNTATNEQVYETEPNNTASQTTNLDGSNSNTVSSADSALEETIGSETTEIESENQAEIDTNIQTDANTENAKSDKENNSRTLTTILTIAIILALGGCITFVAIYTRKKSSKNK